MIKSSLFIALVAISLVCVTHAHAAGTPPPAAKPAIVAADGENLLLSEVLSPEHLILSLSHPVHDWFAGTFTHLSTAAPTTFEFSMDGNDTERDPADVVKWLGLLPVFTYADTTKYESYEWFTKDTQGRWVSGDPFKHGDARLAGTGEVPEQQVIPAKLAAQFLSADRNYWSPWCAVEKAKAQPALNCFRFTQRFAAPTATVAMRVPCTDTFFQAVLDKLRLAHLPGVSVDVIGASAHKRPLQAIRLDPPAAGSAGKDELPTVLVYAREHGTEQDGSWLVYGMLRWLLSEDEGARQARQGLHWLLIPILDPDGAAEAHFNVGDNYVATGTPTPESLAYAAYLVRWIDAGHRLDLVVDLHSIECAEGPHLFCPFVYVNQQALVTAFNQTCFDRISAAGYNAGIPQGVSTGIQPMRLFGWAIRCFGSEALTFEANSRNPLDPLTLARTQQLGALLARQLALHVTSPDVAPLRTEMIRLLTERKTQRETW